jgi:hypothetical protein
MSAYDFNVLIFGQNKVLTIIASSYDRALAIITRIVNRAQGEIL